MQQALRHYATAGIALVCVSTIAVAPLVRPPELQRPTSAAVNLAAFEGLFDLFAYGQPQEAFANLTTGPSAAALPLIDGITPITDAVESSPGPMAGIADTLYDAFLVLVESTVVAFQNIFDAAASGDLFALGKAILDFPTLVVLPPLVVLINDLLSGGDTSATGTAAGLGGVLGDGLAAGVPILGLGDGLGQFGAELTDGLNAAFGPLLSDLGFDALLP